MGFTRAGGAGGQAENIEEVAPTNYKRLC